MTLAQQIHADARSALASRTLRVAVPSIAVLAILVTLGLVSTSGTDTPVADLATPWGQGEVLVDPLSGLFVAAVLAAFWGAAHRDGEILWHFLATDRRWRVAGAALVVAAAVGLVVGAAAAVAKVASLHVALPATVAPAWWEGAHGPWALGGGVLAATTFAVVATCVAFLVRHASAALAVVLGWVLLLEPVVVGLVPREVRTWFPGHALIAVRDHVAGVATVQALVTSLCYTAVLVAVTLVVVHRRDPA